MKCWWSIALLALLACSEQEKVQEEVKDRTPECILLESNWTFKAVNDSTWYPATVPGVVHTDLHANHLIPDPMYGNNEQELQWIGETDWEYRTVLVVKEGGLAKKHMDLCFDGLDTYADVYVNDSLVLEANNMFRSWRIGVKPLLHIGENNIRVVFHSPMKVTKEPWDSLGYELPAGNDAAEQKASVFTRKAPYHFGWDWAPRYLTAGIWKPVYMEVWDEVRVHSVQIMQEELTDDKARFLAAFDVESTERTNANLSLMLGRGPALVNEKVSLQPGRQEVFVYFDIENPHLWWPNGLGEQYLYTMNASFQIENRMVEKATETFGVRTVTWEGEVDLTGTAFYFKVNGEPVFIKGANYIPQDVFLTYVQPEDYERLISAATASNMNMLRVWGGGIYENDLFYDLCDRYGILVWQDLMFACSMYPGDSAFVENVVQEVEEQAIRLRNHPSMALWCGNNEIDVAWHNWGWQTAHGYSEEDSAKIWNDYVHLFEDRIPNVLQWLDQDRTYITTSPMSNWGTDENFNHHNMHYWGVWHGTDSLHGFKKYVPRFMSEYGFQSFPELATVQTFADHSQWAIDSEVMENRQKSYKRTDMIVQFMERNYQTPKDFESFLYVSQLLQARALRIAIEAQRKSKPHCMGTLYWQFNDCWAGPSWSTIDYMGRWKAAQYKVRNLYKEVIVIPEWENDTLHVWINSDRLDSITAPLRVAIGKLSGQPIYHEIKPAIIPPNSSQLHYQYYLPNPSADMVVTATLGNEPCLSQQHLYFVAPKDLPLKKPNIQVEFHEGQEGYSMTITTDFLAKDVWLDAGKHVLEDNYFDLLPGTMKRIGLNEELYKHFKKELRITSLWDTYN